MNLHLFLTPISNSNFSHQPPHPPSPLQTSYGLNSKNVFYSTQHLQPTINNFPMKNIFDYSGFQSKHILDSHRSYSLGSILKKINSRPCLQARNNIILHLLINNWNNTYNNILILNCVL